MPGPVRLVLALSPSCGVKQYLRVTTPQVSVGAGVEVGDPSLKCATEVVAALFLKIVNTSSSFRGVIARFPTACINGILGSCISG